MTSTLLSQAVWTPMPAAVILDFDGLMVDTEYAIYTSWARVFASEGLELPLDLFNECLGSGYSHWDPGTYLEKLTGKKYDWDAINAQRQVELEADLEEEGLLPGVLEIMDYADAQGLPLGVASSSSGRWVRGWLERLGIIHRFQTVVCRTDGYAVKPAPDLFLAAALLLDISPNRCLVFEDSRNGVAAAQAAGMRVVAVPNRVTAAALPFPGQDIYANNLLDVLPLEGDLQ